MLPECRAGEYLFPVPKFELAASDVASFMEDLGTFHGEFHDCFTRSETRENVLLYMNGLFSKLERKSIEPIAVHLESGRVRAMQRSISETPWDDDAILNKYRSMVNEDFGDPSGVLIFDECGFAKKGDDSVGVARQYCGNLGKVDNCQVGVYAAYASRHGYAVIDKRLFIPEGWFGDEYKERREKCELPDELAFKTKPQLAVEMLEGVRAAKVPFRYVAADTVYGESPDFIAGIEKDPAATYFVAIASNTQLWVNAPATQKRKYRYGGKLKERVVLRGDAKKPITAQEFASNLHDFFWYRRTVSEGTKGPIEYEFTKRRVTIARDGLPDKEVWLVIKRNVGPERVYRFSISNAPLSTKLSTFVWLSGMRWPVEQCFEEMKTELGMDHYEVRKYRGWNHHMQVTMLAHFFLWHLKLRLGKKSTSAYFIAGEDDSGTYASHADVRRGRRTRARSVDSGEESSGDAVT